MGTGRPSFLPKRLHHSGQLFFFFSPLVLKGFVLTSRSLEKKKNTLIKTLLLATLFNLYSNSVAVSHLMPIVPGVCGLLPTHDAKKIKSNHSLNPFIRRDKRVSVPLSTSGEHKSNNITVK